ncbi:hypothetical protein [Listeria phage vB_Lmo_2389_typeII]
MSYAYVLPLYKKPNTNVLDFIVLCIRSYKTRRTSTVAFVNALSFF